jgi:hypothetical protein
MTDTARNTEHTDPVSTDGMADLFNSSDRQSQDSFDSQVISFDTVEAASVSQDTTEDSLILELREQISVLRQELINERIEAQRHLQAAVFRNGYLEAQLEGKDNEIKLLTDREQQSKATWWQRFKQIWQKQ